MPESLEYPNFFIMSRLIDLKGKVFSRLTVLEYSHINNNGGAMWNCICKCGNLTTSAASSLKDGRIKSCGCLRKEALDTSIHGHATKGVSSEYGTWRNMKDRCYNKKNNRYQRYGGRGIKVCDRWINSFENFFLDMGKKPSLNHSIDRINNNGNYELLNCRWATSKEQCSNRKNSVVISYKGKTMVMADWVRFLGLSSTTTLRDYIIRNGVEKALVHYATKNSIRL